MFFFVLTVMLLNKRVIEEFSHVKKETKDDELPDLDRFTINQTREAEFEAMRDRMEEMISPYTEVRIECLVIHSNFCLKEVIFV